MQNMTYAEKIFILFNTLYSPIQFNTLYSPSILLLFPKKTGKVIFYLLDITETEMLKLVNL